MKSYCWSACTLPARSGGSCSSSWRRCCGEILDDLLAALVARLPRLVDAPVDAGALLLDDLVELLGDVVVDAAEVARLELLAPALAKPLEHVAQAHRARSPLRSRKPCCIMPAQRGVEVAVVEEVVGHLLEQRVGVEIEADLGAVPARVLESLGLAPPQPHSPEATGSRRAFSRLLDALERASGSPAGAVPSGASAARRS